MPREDRLRKWYQTMLETAKDEGIVDTITTLYDEHFRDPNNDATVLPYMEVSQKTRSWMAGRLRVVPHRAASDETDSRCRCGTGRLLDW